MSLNRILEINPRDPPSRGNKTSSKSRLLAKVWAKGESYFGWDNSVTMNFEWNGRRRKMVGWRFTIDLRIIYLFFLYILDLDFHQSCRGDRRFPLIENCIINPTWLQRCNTFIPAKLLITASRVWFQCPSQHRFKESSKEICYSFCFQKEIVSKVN